MAKGELAAGALLVFLLASGDFTVSSLLLVRTLPVEIHDQLALGRPASAAWTALPLLGFVLLAAIVLARRAAPDPEAPAYAGASRRGGWAHWMLLAGVALGFVAPLAGCAAGAFGGIEPARLALSAGLPALAVSVRLAAAAALLAVLLGAVRVVCWPEQSAAPLRAAGLVLLAVPGAFLAAGLLMSGQFGREGLETLGGAGGSLSRHAPASVLLGLAYFLRFAYLPLRLAEESLRGMDPVLLESAELAGHSRTSRGLSIALPLAWRHLLAAGALVFVLALGELPVSQHLAPAGATPLSVWLFAEQHYGYTEAVFALSLLAGGSAALLLGLAGLAASTSAGTARFGASGWRFFRARRVS
ncbi:MAG: hypothetical protein M5U26_02590 [Planctomycetota bacterium]|nr:hypothetical protein [Planctomycetota bacterium]